ncbi:glucan-binding repeat [uncultured Clostridium sp.]|nr:glucan-binding repeat [uncultured Clostridium sp.]
MRKSYSRVRKIKGFGPKAAAYAVTICLAASNAPLTALAQEETGKTEMSKGEGQEETGNKGTGIKDTGDEEAGSEGAGKEEAGSEGTGKEEAGSEGAGNEGAGSEGAGGGETGNEGAGGEETGNNESGNNESGSEGTGSGENGTEGTGNNGTGSGETGTENNGPESGETGTENTENTENGENSSHQDAPDKDKDLDEGNGTDDKNSQDDVKNDDDLIDDQEKNENIPPQDQVDPDQLDPDQMDPDQMDPDVVNPDQLDPDQMDPDQLNPDLLNPEVVQPELLMAAALNNVVSQNDIPELIAEDDNGNMKFILERNGFDIGGYNGETYIKSSYSGYRSRILMADSRSSDTLYFSDDLKADKNGLEIYLRAEIIPIDDVSYVRLTYYVENTTDDKEIGFSLGLDADTCVGRDDMAKVQRTDDGILMLGRDYSQEEVNEYVNAFVVKDDDESEAPIDRWWYGYYGNRFSNIFAGDLPEEDLEDMDSGMACSWLDLSLDAGETGKYSVIFGIGDIYDYSDAEMPDTDDGDDGEGHDDTEYWSVDGDKWTFSYGNSYRDQWGYLYYNGNYNWYYFDQDGHMVTGWFTAPDGRKFYLNPSADGKQGAMCTGWNQIDGKWYYFSQEQGAGQGQLLVRTTTPDGYTVNEKGEWIE